MTFSIDPVVGQALAERFAALGDAPPPARGDVASRRVNVEAIQRTTHGQLPVPADVTMTDFHATADDGASLLLRWYEPADRRPGPAVLYLHGGGMILSNVEIYDGPVARYAAATGVPFLSVEYRYAPEFPAPTHTPH